MRLFLTSKLDTHQFSFFLCSFFLLSVSVSAEFSAVWNSLCDFTHMRKAKVGWQRLLEQRQEKSDSLPRSPAFQLFPLFCTLWPDRFQQKLSQPAAKWSKVMCFFESVVFSREKEGNGIKTDALMHQNECFYGFYSFNTLQVFSETCLLVT